jgi:hypothetical protein
MPTGQFRPHLSLSLARLVSSLLRFVPPQPTRHALQEWSLQAVRDASHGAIGVQRLHRDEGPLERQAGLQGATSVDPEELLALSRIMGRVSRMTEHLPARS